MKIKLFLMMNFVFSIFCFAEEKSGCEITDYKSLVVCAQKQSVEVQLIRQRSLTASKLEGAASQWQNPELGLSSIAKDSEVSQQTASLLFNISLGGKISARRAGARAEYEKALVTEELGIKNSSLYLTLALYRISHLQRESQIQQEAIGTFAKIINQFEKRVARSPEQEVSLTVFRMARADQELALLQSNSEMDKLLREIKITTGIEKDVVLKNLPPIKKDWMTLSASQVADETPQLKQANAEIYISKSLGEQAAADAWPDLKIGPAVQIDKVGSESQTLTGISLSVPLPVFTLNGGVKEYSKHRLREAEMTYAQTKIRLDSERSRLQEKYSLVTNFLKTTFGSSSLLKKHESVEKQFFKGLISGSLVIEAHRQMFELEKKRNETELEALEILGKVLIIDNKFTSIEI